MNILDTWDEMCRELVGRCHHCYREIGKNTENILTLKFPRQVPIQMHRKCPGRQKKYVMMGRTPVLFKKQAD